ncbi:unnamed protein product [Closterium sp. Yama58-4]|nr:unnamed protein product [Closterium sp. Yama58-4]
MDDADSREQPTHATPAAISAHLPLLRSPIPWGVEGGREDSGGHGGQHGHGAGVGGQCTRIQDSLSKRRRTCCALQEPRWLRCQQCHTRKNPNNYNYVKYSGRLAQAIAKLPSRSHTRPAPRVVAALLAHTPVVTRTKAEGRVPPCHSQWTDVLVRGQWRQQQRWRGNGMGGDGMGVDGMGVDGMGGDGMGGDGMGGDGMGVDGMGVDGMGVDGMGVDGMGGDGMGVDGMGGDGMGGDGMGAALTTVDSV